MSRRPPLAVVLGGTFDPIHLGHLHVAGAVARLLRPERTLLVLSALPPHKDPHELTAVEHREAMLRLAIADRPGLTLCTLERDRGDVCYTIDTLRALREGPPPCTPLFVLGLDALIEIPTWHEYERLLAEFDLLSVPRPGVDVDRARRELPGHVAARLIAVGAGAAARRELARQAIGRGGRIFHLALTAVPASSREIRARAVAGAGLEGLVTRSVARYIQSQGLYTREEAR
jgi:nicotinate-nucleotide adenylyltransferase